MSDRDTQIENESILDEIKKIKARVRGGKIQ